MKKNCETCIPLGEFKHRYWFFADTPNILGIVALFEKIYDSEPILTAVSNIREDVRIVQYRYFN